MYFLKQVVDYYISKAKTGKIDLADYTFVLPNKRSAMFVRKYLKETRDDVYFMPRLTTITAFTQEFCETPLARNTELLFILYKSYIKVLEAKGHSDQIKDFDSFIFWGLVTLNDFNDVDAYLVDAAQIFKNLFLQKEIEANYLTPEQVEVAKMLGEKRPLKVDVDNFWKHMPSSKESGQKIDKFLNLWEILGDLYIQFNKDLKELGLTYSGHQAKAAIKKIKSLPADYFQDKRYAFIGFYVLSTARCLMFKMLRDRKVADFFWDTASPLLHVPGNNAGDIIFNLAKEFKKPEDFELEEITTTPEITIYPVASKSAQAKACANVMTKWKETDKENADKRDITTGIVLPDEKLLMPMMYSVPKSYFPLNVAMKIPFANTPMASLLSTILRMHDNARKIRGSFHFFYKDVLEILSNPNISNYLPSQVTELRNQIIKEHIFNLDSAETCAKYPELAFIFKAIDDSASMSEVKAYLVDLLKTLKSFTSEIGIVDAYESAIDEVFQLAKKYEITMKEHTTFTLVRRLLSAMEIHFNGNPVWGLQIMNMQDARVLDFDDLAILSVNEGTLPRKNSKPSLIPPSLRHGFAMPTHEDEDKTLAYQFFRLITRAKRVAIFYDARTPDLSSGEKSRFIDQLNHMLEKKPIVKDTALNLVMCDPKKIEIEKTPSVMSELNEFKAGGNLNFSASALKNYIKCKIMFYLANVKRLRKDDFAPEYMDSSAYGSVLHKIAEVYYSELKERLDGDFITPDIIKNELKNPHLREHLRETALKAMCELYYGNKYLDRLDTIPGEGRVLAKLMAEYIVRMLRCESTVDEQNPNSRDFIFLSGEDNGGAKVHHWKVDDKHNINFTMSIDRIDSYDKAQCRLRFIDYKTSSDKLSAREFEYLFTNTDYGAIFQLLLYCMAYADVNNCPDKIIQPLIYRFCDMSVNGIPSIKISQEEILDYRQEMTLNGEHVRLVDAFRERFSKLLDEIFDETQPFTQTDNIKNCLFCNFQEICGRHPKKDF